MNLEEKTKKTKSFSHIYLLHYVKLVFRSVLFIMVLVYYILDKVDVLKKMAFIPIFVWIVLVAEMIIRFFPSRFETMGCQKQFARNYEPIGENAVPINQSWKRTALVAAVWLGLNAVIGALYFAGIFDAGLLFLIAIGFSVCDIICILFFCPFQTWFMKNRCCTTCRIYNWDFAMMFTPLVFIPRVYNYTLLGFALILLIRWEITFHRHPERFSTVTNKCVDCSRCEEKLCHHKKQLRGFLKKYRTRFFGTK